jgi:hypothetical protein
MLLVAEISDVQTPNAKVKVKLLVVFLETQQIYTHRDKYVGWTDVAALGQEDIHNQPMIFSALLLQILW